MNLYNQNLLILFNTGRLDEKAIKEEIEYVNALLKTIESPEKFCIVFELVNRNQITNKQKTLMKESKHLKLRPFRFLINKN
jgi:hypothetical protein